jgi:basic membrane protein A and related proteins
MTNLIDNMEETAEQFNKGKLTRRQLFSKALKMGLTVPVAYAFLKGTVNPFAPSEAHAAKPDKKYKERKKVGMITIQRLGDKGPVDSCYRGLQQGGKNLNCEVKIVEALAGEYQEAVEALSNDGFNLILGLFPPMGDSLKKAAAKYPNIYYGNLVGNIDGTPNLQSRWHAGHEDCFLTGAIAGFFSKKKKQGITLATENSEQWGYLAGYEQGFKHVLGNDAKYIYNVVGGTHCFEDLVKGKQLALILAERGCDVIHPSGGKTAWGTLDGAAEAEVLATGIDTDQCFKHPEIMTASCLRYFDYMIYLMMKEWRDGEFKPGYTPLYMKDGVMDLCLWTDDRHNLGRWVPNSVKNTVAQLRADVINQKIKISPIPAHRRK